VKDILSEYIVEVIKCLEEVPQNDLYNIVKILTHAYQDRSQVFIMGNGGSSSTAAHFASDLRKPLDPDKTKALKAFCLTDNTPLHTAIANDIDSSAVFSSNLAAILEPKDVVIAISVSGNSPNILEATKLAKQKGAITIGFSGCGGVKLAALADFTIVLSSREYGPVEDTHLCLAHLIAKMLREYVERINTSGSEVMIGENQWV